MEGYTAVVGGQSDASQRYIGRKLQTPAEVLVEASFFFHDSLVGFDSCSSHGAEGRAPTFPADAGGDLWPPAANSDRERHGRCHQVHQREGEASGALHLLLQQEGESRTRFERISGSPFFTSLSLRRQKG